MIEQLTIPYTDPLKMIEELQKTYNIECTKKWGVYYIPVPPNIGKGWSVILIKNDIHFIKMNATLYHPIEFKSPDKVEDLLDIRIRIGGDQRSSYIGQDKTYNWMMQHVNAVSIFIPKSHIEHIDPEVLKEKVKNLQLIPSIKRNLDQILITEYINDYSALKLEGQLLSYAHSILEYIHQPVFSVLDTTKMKMITEAKRILDAEYIDPPSINQLSRSMGTNPTDLSQTFKTYYNKTIHQYCIDLKINRAIELVTETQLPITEIIRQVGYQNRSHFNRLYKERMNMTPSKHRRSISLDTNS